ncbi:UNVERIFIED_CONTAM: hypothetical protein K2H54_043692 [Gekko kuhli]
MVEEQLPFQDHTSQSPPSLFPLISSDYTNAGDITVGCLAKDFLPDSLTFSWQKPNNESLEAEKIRRYPSLANSNGVYTTSSEATIPTNQWEASEPFFCKAEHSSGTRVARVVRPSPCNYPEPKIIVRIPTLEDFRGPYLNATLLCKADDLHTEKTTLKWLKEGNVLSSGFTTSAPTKQAHGGYSTMSELIVTKKDWFADKVFSCQVQNEKYDEIRNVSKLSVCEDCSGTGIPVRVEAIPPSFEDIYMTKSVKLTCRTSNIPFEQDLAELNVTWIRQHSNGGLEVLPTEIGQSKEQEDRDLVSVDATANVCIEDWESGDNFQCIVALPLLASTETRSLKKENGGSRSPPSVYVQPPPLEELALKETATITCLIKNFFPGDFFVRWMRNNEPVGVSESYTSNPMQESKSPKRYFSYSLLKVTEQEWSAGDTFTCMVGHEALPYQTTQKTIDKNTGKPTHVNVSLVLSDMTSSCY